ncbi:MAG: Na+/H+ antiporter NhaA [Deltaproteobacteria bacterium]|nr:Na+/H+ antiporter NhaA [Deltaproteobacteria bacterium]
MEPTETRIERGFGRVLTPLENFIYKQTTAGFLLFIAAFVSMVLANSPWNGLFEAFAAMELGFIAHDFRMVFSLREWTSSGLMALFFFLIGLEIKREILAGKLREMQHVRPILVAAAGGMVVPAALYWMVNGQNDAAHGWAIPMATDTAFAIAALALFAKRASPGIAIFLAALAIFDDIGAILVVAFFYTRQLDTAYLIQAAIALAALSALNILGVRRGWTYAVVGVMLWWFVHQSGVHATVAGLLGALAVPARTQLGQGGFTEKMKAALSVFEQKFDFGRRIIESPEQHSLAMEFERTVKSAVTPLQRWHTLLLTPVGIIVLPLFALLSAGIDLSGESLVELLSSSVTMGVVAGLAIGKPLGIVLFTAIALKLKVGKLPAGMSMAEIVSVGLLSGIGFTMSLFITTLSFQEHPEFIEPAKLGIIAGSLASAIAAWAWTIVIGRRKANRYQENLTIS